MKNKITSILLLSILVLTSIGCNDWLDVKPQAQINADKLFSTPAGFENALYGIYTSMTDPSLYGTEMTFGMMDVLAQYYKVHTNQYHSHYEVALYNYNNGTVRDLIKQAWLKSYNTIANCNVLLEYLEEKPVTFFDETKYKYLLAEIKAIRAYLHFDLLRAFAPSWEKNPDALCLPYADNFTNKTHKQKTTREITTLLLKDLEDARETIKEVDTALEDWFKDMYYHYQSDLGKEFVSYRAYRLNYWAITGLIARIYHYMGDSKAYTYAQEVIEGANDGYFQFTYESEFSAPLTSRDVVMKNEILFALNYSEVHNLWYSYDAISSSAFQINDLASIYPVTDDFRRQYLVIKNTRSEDISVKYADVKSSKGGKIPMIRLSEMYMIAAETCFDNNSGEAIELLEKLKRNRGLVATISPSISKEDFINELTLEARREFIGEGQLFYWYKRLNLPIQQGSGSVTINPSQFCLPLPSAEVEFGNRKEDYLNLN